MFLISDHIIFVPPRRFCSHCCPAGLLVCQQNYKTPPSDVEGGRVSLSITCCRGKIDGS